MHHGKINKNTAKGLKTLRKWIDKAKIPPSRLDERVTIATWNIREFGRKRRLKSSLHYIAEIVGQFDLVAVTELRDDIRDLKEVMAILGPYWRVVFSDFNADPKGNRERIAYVHDNRAITFTGLASEPDTPRKVDPKTKKLVSTLHWWRSPYIASFRAGDFDFILITAHIRWGAGVKARLAPIQGIADWIEARRNEQHVIDKDILLMGDFNIPSTRSSLFRAITSRGLQMPRALLGIQGSNLAKKKRYDQILHYPLITKCFTGKGGVLDFYPYTGSYRRLFPGTAMSKNAFTYQLSDHLPLWVEVDVDTDDERLDQILNA